MWPMGGRSCTPADGTGRDSQAHTSPPRPARGWPVVDAPPKNSSGARLRPKRPAKGQNRRSRPCVELTRQAVPIPSPSTSTCYLSAPCCSASCLALVPLAAAAAAAAAALDARHARLAPVPLQQARWAGRDHPRVARAQRGQPAAVSALALGAGQRQCRVRPWCEEHAAQHDPASHGGDCDLPRRHFWREGADEVGRRITLGDAQEGRCTVKRSESKQKGGTVVGRRSTCIAGQPSASARPVRRREATSRWHPFLSPATPTSCQPFVPNVSQTNADALSRASPLLRNREPFKANFLFRVHNLILSVGSGVLLALMLEEM